MSIATKEQIIKDLKIALAHNGTPEEVQAFLNEPYTAETIDMHYLDNKERYERGECTEEQVYSWTMSSLGMCLDLLYE